MNKNRVSLKDIARHSNVSLGTVHRAIYNKKGVGDETRERIIKTAMQMGYKVNLAASTLKRKPIRIAVVLPEAVNNEKYFFTDIWKGIDAAISDLMVFNVEVLKIPFKAYCEDQTEVLESLYNNYKSNLDGLLTIAWHKDGIDVLIDRFVDAGTEVVTVNIDAPNSKRIGCAYVSSYKRGQVAGELICWLTHNDGQCGKIVLVGGKPELQSHRECGLGFVEYMRENCPDVSIVKIYDLHSDNNKVYDNLKELLVGIKNIRAIYSNNPRNSIPVCKVIEELNLGGQVIVVGSDIFEENLFYLNKGIMQAIIFQNPYLQAYNGIKMLFNYIVKSEFPVVNQHIEVAIVMKSNLEFYLR